MKNKLISIFGMGVMMLGIFVVQVTQACAQSQPEHTSGGAVSQTWDLPQSTTVKDTSTRTYRFTVVYNSTNMRGEMLRRQRLTGDYTRGLPEGKVRWDNVAEDDANGATAPYGPPQAREFMDGFTYVNNLGDSMKPDFFKGFPPTAVFERNLVWDTGMFELFGQNYFSHLKLNEPYSSGYDEDMTMPGVGTFRNHKVELEYIGRSERNGEQCALISYQAFFNPLEINNGGMDMKGRSDYWGLIWVSLATRQIEYATLSETVTAELKLPGQDTIQNINVLRSGDFQLIKK